MMNNRIERYYANKGTWYPQAHRDIEHTFTNRRQNERSTLNITIASHYP